MIRWIACCAFAVFMCQPLLTLAANQEEFTIIIKDHKFAPPQLNIPSNKKIKLTINNQDPTPEEFESFELNREKVVSGNKKIVIYLGPLKPGSYKYFGEFHKDTAQGVIVAQ